MHRKVNNLNSFKAHPAWSEVQIICQNLVSNGFEALLAGGCVRDLVMNRMPKDFDIATNATPDQIIELYPKALSVGREFGVIILAFQNFQIEIASFRKDGPYLDGRRPSHISFATPNEDAMRRDFTINALFLDLKEMHIIDDVNGLTDIDAKIIRAVGDPEKRFSEDKLRMLRALRFSSQLEFKIDAKTLLAIENQSREITVVSGERIKDELTKWILSSNLKPCLMSLWSTGLIRSIHPIFENHFDQYEFDRILQFFSKDLSKLNALTKFGIFFSFITKQNQKDEFDRLKKILKDLKFSSDQSAMLQWVLQNSFNLVEFEKLRLSHQIEICAHPYFKLLEEFTEATDLNIYSLLEPRFKRLKEEYLVDGQLPRPLINGDDLKLIGIKAGKDMGSLLSEIYSLQIEKELSSADEARNYAKSRLKLQK